MTRPLRIVAVLIATVGALLITPLLATTPAQAGGWATTLLDPLPPRLEPGTAYTVGYWVLQHGSHTYEGDLGKTALRVTDGARKVVTTYPGVRLPEPGHYAAAVVFTHGGTFQLTSLQGLFGEYEVGEVTVPGGITVRPTPVPRGTDDGHSSHWGAIRPPMAASGFPTGDATPSPAAATSAGSADDSVRPAALILGVGLPVVAIALLFGWRLRSRRPDRRPAAPGSSTP
jgi:hypothetical protein